MAGLSLYHCSHTFFSSYNARIASMTIWINKPIKEEFQMANFGKIIKMVAGLTTAAVGGIVALKAGKTADKATDTDVEVIEDEELKELAEMEAAEETPEEEPDEPEEGSES